MNSNLQDIEQEHHLRFSIEFYSIKDLHEPFCIYFKYSHPLLGTGRTSSFQAAKMIETQFFEEFQSHEFYMTREGLIESLDDLVLELWHKDKFQKDEFIGKFIVDLPEILNSDLKKTENSVLRVLDLILKENFGQLHVLLYLEDLGPKDQAVVNALPQGTNDWELQVWRKAEESKWLSELKARETEHLKAAASEWVLKESKREQQHEKALVDLSSFEVQLRSKLLDLQKRENKISAIEEEIKSKTSDIQRQIEIKDEELSMLKNKVNDIKLNTNKSTKNLKASIQQTKDELAKIEEEIVKIRKFKESQEAKDLKKELGAKKLDYLELSKKFEQVKSIKETFEAQFNKLRTDMAKCLRIQDAERKQRADKQREDITRRRLELETIRYQREEAVQIKELKEKMLELKTIIK
jgi:hypothetical protein